MEDSSYPSGLDCAWLASDRENCVAVFITAGCGPVPVDLLDLLSREDGDLEPLIHLLPVVSEARLLVTIPSPDSFIELCKRGLYVYDWTDVHRSAAADRDAYELVATPTRPIDAEALSDELARHAQDFRLVGSRFGEARFLDVRQDLLCVCGN